MYLLQRFINVSCTIHWYNDQSMNSNIFTQMVDFIFSILYVLIRVSQKNIHLNHQSISEAFREPTENGEHHCGLNENVQLKIQIQQKSKEGQRSTEKDRNIYPNRSCGYRT